MPVACPRCLASFPHRAQFCGLCGAEIPGTEETIQTYPDPLVGMVVSDRYRIVSLLGRGGIGAVYRAEHTAIGKPVALKVLHGNLGHRKDVIQRFRREAEAASKLTHIHTVQVFDYGHWRGLTYLVMEYLRGADLGTVVRRDGPLPWRRIVPVAIQICDSLDEAHQLGIVHRDVKPENVLLAPRAGHPDFVKVVDFGMAKIRDDRSAMDITGDGSMLGTPFYMAPEQIRGEPVDARTDIYAIGGLLYRCLTGLVPFEAPTPFAVLTKHLSENLTPPSARAPGRDVPPAVEAIVMRAMAKDPGDRFQSAREMRRTLADAAALEAEGLAAGTPARLSRPSAPVDAAAPSASLAPPAADQVDLSRGEFERYVRRLKRRRWIGGATAVVLLVGGAAAAIAAPSLLRPPPGPVTEEFEPNDDPTHANRIPLGVPVSGTIGRRLSAAQGDLDHFRVTLRPLRQRVLRVEVTGIPAVDLRLDVYSIAGGEPLATTDRAGPGGGEALPGLLVDGLDYFVRVSERLDPGAVPTERLSDRYSLTATVLSPSEFEGEPNDDPATAIELRAIAGKMPALRGYIDVHWDRDTYCIEVGATPAEVRVAPPAALDVAIDVAGRVVDERGPGEAETVPMHGDRCLVVRSADAGKTGAIGAAEAYRIEIVRPGVAR